MYGSSLSIVTFSPRDSNKVANDAAAIPLPKDDTTPPVTNTYFVIFNYLIGKRNYTFPM